MYSKEVDAYIQNATESNRPILNHLRELFHEVYPEIEENIKWKGPSFEIKGKIVSSMMSFKKHVNFIFIHGEKLPELVVAMENLGDKSGMKGFKNLQNLSDLPSDEDLKKLIEIACSAK